MLVDLEGFNFRIEGGLGKAEPGGGATGAGHPAFGFREGGFDHFFFLRCELLRKGLSFGKMLRRWIGNGCRP